MNDEEKKIIEKIKDSVSSDGAKVLLDDIIRHRDASQDVTRVSPLIDRGVQLTTLTEELLKRNGYILALNWVIGLFDYYKNYSFEDDPDEV